MTLENLKSVLRRFEILFAFVNICVYSIIFDPQSKLVRSSKRILSSLSTEEKTVA